MYGGSTLCRTILKFFFELSIVYVQSETEGMSRSLGRDQNVLFYAKKYITLFHKICCGGQSISGQSIWCLAPDKKVDFDLIHHIM